MKSFQNQILAHAVALRAETTPAEPWLQSARDALAEFHAPEGGDAPRLAERLAAIEDWPKAKEEGAEEAEGALAAALDDHLKPIRELLANAFCKIGKDKAGREAALLWGGEALAAAAEGGLVLESKAEGVFKNRSPLRMFDNSTWGGGDGAAEGSNYGFMSPSRFEKFFDIYGLGESAQAADSLARRPKGQASPAAGESRDFESLAKAFAEQKGDEGPSDWAVSQAVARGALGLAIDGMAAADVKRLRELQRSLSGVLPLVEVLLSEKEPPEPPLSESAAGELRGVQRALELSNALEQAGTRALEGARGDAGARLVSFMEKVEPESGLAGKFAESIWGLPLSAEASLSAAAWLPVAKRLMSEDPRRAALALTIAPDLGLSPSFDLLAQTKAALKEAGLPEGAWKAFGELPKEDFETVLGLFKRAARQSTEYGSGRSKIVFAELLGGSERVMKANPFEGVAPTGASKELTRVCERCAFAYDAAVSAGLPFSSAVGFALSRDPTSSPAWKARQEKETGRDCADAIDQEFFDWGRASAEARFVDFCLGPEGEDENQRESPEDLAAARKKGPKVLALAMREAMSRPFKETRAEFSDMTDWFRRSEAGLWRQLPEKMTWASLRRREQAWHKELAAAKDPQFSSPWETMLSEPVGERGLMARELASGAELFEEGKAMRHCVSSYAQECREGSSRIYSITDDQGRRVATLEAGLGETLNGSPAARVAQLRGVANQLIEDPAVHALCEKIIERLNETAQAKARSENSQLPKGKEEGAPSLLPALAQRREAAGGRAEPARPRA